MAIDNSADNATYPLRPQPSLDERDPLVLRRHIDVLLDELITAGGQVPDMPPDLDLHDHIGWLNEALTQAYHRLSGKESHTRGCPVSQGYVYRPGPCNCGGAARRP